MLAMLFDNAYDAQSFIASPHREPSDRERFRSEMRSGKRNRARLACPSRAIQTIAFPVRFHRLRRIRHVLRITIPCGQTKGGHPPTRLALRVEDVLILRTDL